MTELTIHLFVERIKNTMGSYTNIWKWVKKYYHYLSTLLQQITLLSNENTIIKKSGNTYAQNSKNCFSKDRRIFRYLRPYFFKHGGINSGGRPS